MLKGIINGPNSTLDKSLSEGDAGLAAVTANLVLSTLENGRMKEQTKNQVSTLSVYYRHIQDDISRDGSKL